MARKKKLRTQGIHDADSLHLPTSQRMAKGGISIRNNAAFVDEPMRIDKLLKNGIIDEMQHLYGLQIITYWTIASRPFIRAASYEPRICNSSIPGLEFVNISRMGAEDKFYKTMEFLSKRERMLISKICFEEMAVIEAGRSIGLPVNSITSYVRAAFDALGNALARARDLSRKMEKADQE